MSTPSSISPSAYTAETLALLVLSDLATGRLTKEQIRGADCVWCETPLSIETAIDFGARSGTFAGAVTAWYPRGCLACVRKAALTAYTAHPETCEQCVDDPSVCDTGRALRHLELKNPQL
ncbi:hypothetical protein [Streptomyces tagetis]|uniref:Uncharacterized protein n=1 Tax=Streptomyces tagetis TaxID=2820809 RepID=A0A941B1X9_9ACTN|nr:hypothetical protein [Streptomyces sp. RG38]MBQ0828910.1 hypothetical protein [Streptomyces sp. RG38]